MLGAHGLGLVRTRNREGVLALTGGLKLGEDLSMVAWAAVQDEDPDRDLSVPVREVRVALALVDALLDASGAQPALALELANALLPLDTDPLARLPEVGPVTDVEGLRLHLHRLSERLRNRVPYAPPAPAPPIPPHTRVLGGVPIRRASRAETLQDQDLADAFVWWDDVTADDVLAYRAVLEAADNERPLQRHLATNPTVLVQHLRGGHGRWVLSQKRLGSEYVTDFVIGERSSSGLEWQFVELQSPSASLFVPSSGRLGTQLDEGIRQIQEWRRWLDDNRDYARRPRARNGLGLEDASGADPGLLIIGREVGLSVLDKQRRRQLDRDLNIRIRTYDWLLREAESRLNELKR